MSKGILALCLAGLTSATVSAAELVFAESGKSDYQIVIPDKGKDETVDRWLLMTARLMRAVFEKNGFRVGVVKEEEKAQEKPGIYLFGVKAPAPRERWGFNAARNRIGQYMLWRDARGMSDTKALGELIFCACRGKPPH